MTCRELIEFLMDYLDGELAAVERVRFDDHLARCPDCRAYLRNYQETIKAGRAALTASDEQTADGIPEQLVQAILASRTGKNP